MLGTDGYNGIFLNNSLGYGANTNNKIKENKITNAGLSGIVIRDSNFNRIKDNRVTGSIGFDLSDPTWGNGISLENSTDNRIEDNRVESNARHGIFADLTSIDNLIEDNRSQKNAEDDYHDESTGTGTAGTGNTYDDNRGKTEDPAGLID